MLKAEDIMRKDIPAVQPETTVEELGRLFIEERSTGLPVVDKNGQLLGIVTEHDLISQNRQFHIPTVLRLFDAFIPLEGSKVVESEIKKMSATVVSDLCTRELITVREDATLDEIATIMTEKKVHHIPVLKGDKLVGMIEQHDVIKGIAVEGSDKGA
jgi:CBS domain-containing protein